MRLLIFELHPPELEKEGLAGMLQARLAAVEARAGLRTEIRIEGERRLPLAVEEELFHIAQEILNNVVKHARASRVAVALRFDEETVRLEVSDDGVGFDPRDARASGGMGLRGMEERVARLHGALSILSTPHTGTRVVVNIGAPAEKPGF